MCNINPRKHGPLPLPIVTKLHDIGGKRNHSKQDENGIPRPKRTEPITHLDKRYNTHDSNAG
ncbi:hypothetical protein [Allomuricauda sp. ARW1Y1]|uniref:hypothetical protein n=1 Tax=Allomuricauda sp. ARW1Y1 TaxID=2663843 RepID=UPI0015C9A8D9|nr:hypothetical protein [Muricauda sp. ARW1Y1]NYJ28625.1 hypothetical protein [Muricauda sp. ARW1Y1]